LPASTRLSALVKRDKAFLFWAEKPLKEKKKMKDMYTSLMMSLKYLAVALTLKQSKRVMDYSL
tara:strand:- start:315 stop:503 length:189 start_codon:yes stop_codon:yes gene_type:complete